VFDSGNNEKNRERQGYGLTILQIFKQQEKEVQLLNDERENLLDIEKKLLFMINETIEAKIRKNQKLRLEVEKQKKNCMKLARFLNATINWHLANSVRFRNTS
jgi:hypothetical protein